MDVCIIAVGLVISNVYTVLNAKVYLAYINSFRSTNEICVKGIVLYKMCIRPLL